MESLLVACRSGLPLEPDAFPRLTPLASDPPGFEHDGSRVYLGDPAAYLQDLRLDAAGQGALAAGLALLPGEEPPAFREVLYAGGTSALRELLSVCTVSQDAVVWDSEDRPSRLSEYLDRL